MNAASARHFDAHLKDTGFQATLKLTLDVVQQAQAFTHIVQGQATAVWLSLIHI